MRDAMRSGEPHLGTYLTDGKSLFYVVDDSTRKGMVRLEDCQYGTLKWWGVPDVLRDLRLVRPQVAATAA